MQKACAYDVRKVPIRDLLISINKTRGFEWQTAHTKGCLENRCVIPVKLGMIVRDDQSDHRACAARSCRGILVFGWGGGGGAKNFSSSHSPYHQTWSENNQTYQVCSKTCLLKICTRHFLISQYFLFYATSTIKKYPLKRAFPLYFRRFVKYHVRQESAYSSLRPRSAGKIWTRNSIGKWYEKPLKFDENRDQNGGVWHRANEVTRSNSYHEVYFAWSFY